MDKVSAKSIFFRWKLIVQILEIVALKWKLVSYTFPGFCLFCYKEQFDCNLSQVKLKPYIMVASFEPVISLLRVATEMNAIEEHLLMDFPFSIRYR